jgi:hypothetical protein
MQWHGNGRRWILSGLLALASTAGFTQSDAPPTNSAQAGAKSARGAIIAMPADRADDSYAIYSLLAQEKGPANSPSAQNAPRAVVAVTANEDDRNPRVPPQGQLKPPPNNPTGFEEALGDYEANKYARVQLQNGLHHPYLPLIAPGSAKSSGNPVTYFSEVYFDSKHQAALVYMYEWCANLCAAGSWVYLEKHGGQWVRSSGVVVPGA